MMKRQLSPQNCLLQKINEISFTVNDLHLYLDTHPSDQKALDYFNQVSAQRQSLLTEYTEKFGPLTISEAMKSSETSWKWIEQPFPWEQEGV